MVDKKIEAQTMRVLEKKRLLKKANHQQSKKWKSKDESTYSVNVANEGDYTKSLR